MEEFPSLKTPAIIAFKGLPATGKSDTALLLAKWAKSPVLFIENFLAKFSPDAGGSGNSSSPSMDEAQHLLRRAFDVLCAVAERHARDNEFNCVVIKSRLCTTFELDRLIDLMIRCDSHALLIIECQFSNEYTRRLRFNRDYLKDKHWYKLKTWNEVEIVGEEYDAQAWDHHFESSIAALPNDKRPNVRRLVLDISSDGTCTGSDDQRQIGPNFSWVITKLLWKDTMVQLPNTVVYRDFRQAQIELVLNTPRKKRNHICTGEYCCIFKYQEALEADAYHCSVCEKSISGPGYDCYTCKVALHKSCAEEPTMVNTLVATPYLDLFDEMPFDGMVIDDNSENQYYHFTRKHACDACKELGKPFSYECGSCLLYTHLKCRLMPTIVKHDCHPKHFLYVRLGFSYEVGLSSYDYFTCRGCGYPGFFSRYTCFVCGYEYHIRCVAAPREVMHNHGGYEHVMQLMYSFDGMGGLEDFWCDICHKDMDANEWFYRCKECPYYVSHMDYPSRLPCKDTDL